MQIKVNDISKIYGTNENKVTALKAASMTIFEGDFISIMGPSGSGKSTAGCHRLLSIVTKMLTYGSNKYSCTSSEAGE